MDTRLWKDRLGAAFIHLGISLALAALAALLVFLVWYPYPYREISGGRSLFLLVVSVDVIMGPLMTLVVFNRSKPRRELRRDLTIIGLLQLAALTYGLWTVAVARPVHLVFEIDRFRVVHAIDIPADLLSHAPVDLQQLPLMGPTLLSVREFKDGKESFDATMAALQGVSLSARPDLWQSYLKAKPKVIAHAHPLDELKNRFPARSAEIDRAVADLSPTRPATSVRYLPMIGRNSFWTVLIDVNTAEVIAFVPIDSF
ncbi:MAG: pilus assembly protein [Polaromonas sp.]|uniref:TfpX/TfpZ family type IV pilin accessory protein n=1 Tax=Polaromonas sp. TaxID=1869339 RepID=UPI0018172DCB|nr:TfpX/TfpZ family type IV pilin accessory protein [Polaromonas sp.]NMM09719.1 pilus assembly protein [Polaromonas sp.]